MLFRIFLPFTAEIKVFLCAVVVSPSGSVPKA
jgi:hypothetical protein